MCVFIERYNVYKVIISRWFLYQKYIYWQNLKKILYIYLKQFEDSSIVINKLPAKRYFKREKLFKAAEKEKWYLVKL